MAYSPSKTLRIVRNIIDGKEYAASIVSVNKQLPLNVPENDKAYLILQGVTLEIQHEVSVFPSSLAPQVAAFNPSCVFVVNDRLLPLSSDLLASFVDQALMRSDLQTFEATLLMSAWLTTESQEPS